MARWVRRRGNVDTDHRLVRDQVAAAPPTTSPIGTRIAGCRRGRWGRPSLCPPALVVV